MRGPRKPDVVILDLGLPDGDGVDFIRDLRTWSTIPVIVLSARVSETDKVQALDAGADDYLTKPFGVGELLARVRAVLRRKIGARCREASDVPLRRCRGRSHQARGPQARRGSASHRDRVSVAFDDDFERRKECSRIARYSTRCGVPRMRRSEHYVRVHMGHLRRKLEDDAAQPKHLLTETAVGYRLVP